MKLARPCMLTPSASIWSTPSSGLVELSGRLIMNGAVMVCIEVNNSGGIHGRQIVLVREDDRCDAASAIAAAKKLIFQHQVFMPHGGGCSTASIAGRPEVEKA